MSVRLFGSSSFNVMMSARGGMVVGVLALQGAFKEHVELFDKIGVDAVEVRVPEQLADVHALVLPGGESTAISLIARRWGLIEPLRKWIEDGKPIWGTCAGMILLANKITGKMKQGQEAIGGLEAVVHRNYFGSQLGSFSAQLENINADDPLAPKRPYQAVFIRAPVLAEFNPEVVIALATVKTEKASKEACDRVNEENAVVAARQGNILVTSFHPELTEDPYWHTYFNGMIREIYKQKA